MTSRRVVPTDSTPRVLSGSMVVDRRRRLIRALALLGMALMLGVVALSAYIRLSQTGLDCAGWPGCQGEILRQATAGSTVANPPDVALARQGHRMLASAVLPLTLALLLVTLAKWPRLWREARLALALLLLTSGLAILGVMAGRSSLPAVVLGNLLGGFAMLALCWRLSGVAGGCSRPVGALRHWVRLALLLVLLQIVLGGLISATHGASACGGWSECADIARAAGWSWQTLNPWNATAPDMVVPLQPRGAWLQWLHHLTALVLLPVLALVAWLALRQRLVASALLLYALVAVQFMLGLQLAPLAFPLAQVLVHNLVAAFILALLARWA